MGMELRVSHVGSFPFEYSRDLVEKIVSDLYNIGIDIPPYPQLRSFIDIYLEPLAREGALVKKGDFYFTTRDRLKSFDLSGFKPIVYEAEDMIDFVRRRGIEFKGYRAPVTGVFTLASRIYLVEDIARGLDATVLRDRELVEEYIFSFVVKYIEYMKNLGYTHLFIDEPVLGIMVGRKRILLGYTRDYIIDMLEKLFKIFNGEKGIHVCGRISKQLFSILTEVNRLRYINLEFYDSPQNINVVDKALLKENNKILAPGVASAKKPVVESISEITGLLRKIITVSGDYIDLVSADCGFGGLKGALGYEELYRIVMGKLQNIIEAVRNV
ncbi:MAG: methionine synthase [Desulfurococcales archaeon]|nr:methionine synthase [Desulfurococcales archaeon]